MDDDEVALPYVDAHAVTVAAPRDRTWTAVERHAHAALCAPQGGVLRRLLGTRPPSGFAVHERVPPRRLVLGGRHRFARYRLAFELHEESGQVTRLRAVTWAAFPGPHGRAYRAAVLGTGLHVLATRRILHAMAARAAAASG